MAEMKIIARVRSPFKSKFGIPRQSGIAEEIESEIVFEPEFRNPDAVRGLEEWSHIWLIWQFSENLRDTWSPTVRPPRLGGNTHVGVFATRSPFRPNAVGLSCVKLKAVYITNEGPVLKVKGADLMDGTPIFDIKPYIPYADSRPDAAGGFTDTTEFPRLCVTFADGLSFPQDKRAELSSVLSQDPRPQYHDDPDRVYGMSFAGYDIKFRVSDGILTVFESIPL